MTIAILGGTGKEGYGLALRWAKAGETIIIGSRDAARAQQSADKIKTKFPAAKVSGADNVAAASAADVLVLTVPFEGHVPLLKQIKPALKPSAILIDATVPLAASIGGRVTRTIGIWQGSAAQQAAEILHGTPVVAAFQNISAEFLNGDADLDSDVIVCGDHEPANQVARALAEKIPGVRALDGGHLENARVLEQLTALLITLNIRYKAHTGIRITGLK
jgi:8-hydroxy-5-deazaflavin:NADPH oxidoreductase